MTGKMANRSREIHLDRFRTNDEYKIMIASIKTGGLGLDFSVANKCILVDLWWNEAVQDQVSGCARIEICRSLFPNRNDRHSFVFGVLANSGMSNASCS
jgi:hypothetical protein